MEDVFGKGIAIGILIFIGFLFKVLFEKININIKHPMFFSLILYCIGMCIGYLGWILHEEHGASFLSYSLFVMGSYSFDYRCFSLLLHHF